MTDIVIVPEAPSTDLNQDGVTGISDMSIFMLHLSSSNRLSDFNSDGKVNTADLSILFEKM